MRKNWPCKEIVTTSGEAPNGYRARVTYIEIMRAGCGCWATSPIPFDELRTEATIELGRSGRPMRSHDADVGFAWSGRRRASAARYGVIDQRWPNSAALTWEYSCLSVDPRTYSAARTSAVATYRCPSQPFSPAMRELQK
jgi:hypothetical protein